MKKTVTMSIDKAIKRIEKTAKFKSNWNKKVIKAEGSFSLPPPPHLQFNRSQF